MASNRDTLPALMVCSESKMLWSLGHGIHEKRDRRNWCNQCFCLEFLVQKVLSVAFFIRKSPLKTSFLKIFSCGFFLFPQKSLRFARVLFCIFFLPHFAWVLFDSFPKNPSGREGAFRGAWYKESNPKCLKSWKIWAKFEIFFTLYCVGVNKLYCVGSF